MTLAATLALLRKHGLAPRKAFGQNFLVDPGVLGEIVRIAEIGPADTVVEVGGGLGVLTRELARAAGRLVVVEKDRELAALLTKEAAAPNVSVHRADALYVDFDEILGPYDPAARKALVVANLPYNISTEMVFRLLAERRRFRRFALMLQKEVAERLASPPGSKAYGAISVLVQLWCDVEIALEVPPAAFFPEPEVSSAFVRFDVRETPRVLVEDEAAFARVVKAAFAHRRKTVANSLRSAYPEAAGALEAAGIDPKRRAETLSLDEFARLAEGLE